MRFLFKLILLLIILLPVGVLVAVYFSVQKMPLVNSEVRLTPSQVDRARTLFDQHDPRDLQDGEVRTVKIRKRDLELAVNYFVHLAGRGGAIVVPRDGYIDIKATARLPQNPIGQYLNIDLGLVETAGTPAVEHLKLGDLSVPAWLAQGVISLGAAAFQQKTGRQLDSDLIRNVDFGAEGISITYEWDAELVDAVRDNLVSAEDQARFEIYHGQLVKVLSQGSGTMKMTAVLRSLLMLARDRSDEHNAATENRAAIIVLSSYVSGQGIERLVPAASTWPKAPKRNIELLNRRDFAQHFMISASLAMTGGNVFSNAIGLLKEVDDASGGTGFSFKDLCADKAGTYFGERATAYLRAAEIQTAIARSLVESDIMPRVDDLPENMTEAQFQSRFGGVDAPRYNEMVEKIDRRVEQLPLYN